MPSSLQTTAQAEKHNVMLIITTTIISLPHRPRWTSSGVASLWELGPLFNSRLWGPSVIGLLKLEAPSELLSLSPARGLSKEDVSGEKWWESIIRQEFWWLLVLLMWKIVCAVHCASVGLYHFTHFVLGHKNCWQGCRGYGNSHGNSRGYAYGMGMRTVLNSHGFCGNF